MGRLDWMKKMGSKPKPTKCHHCGSKELVYKEKAGQDKLHCGVCGKILESRLDDIRAHRIKVRDLLKKMHHIGVRQSLGAIPHDKKARGLHMLKKGYTKSEHVVANQEHWKHHSGKHSVYYDADTHDIHVKHGASSRKFYHLPPVDVLTGKAHEAMDNTEVRLVDRIESVTEKFWIQQAISKPGALRAQLHVKGDKPIPAGKLASAAKKGGKLGARARLAQTLKKLHK